MAANMATAFFSKKPCMQLDTDLIEQVETGRPWAYRSWEPDSVAVVLGRGNAPETEVHEARCNADNIPVLRRRGGGGTVVLSPGVVVVSLVKHVKHQFYAKEYFQQINHLIIEALQTLDMSQLCERGHSDICIGDRKILGSSLYRSRTLLFYTASLMVSNDLRLLDLYLKHPSKEPEYRRGRRHQAFVTTIQQEYPDVSLRHVKQALDAYIPPRIPAIQ